MPNHPKHVVSAPIEVDQALASIGLSRDFVQRVARKAAAARAEALPIDPVGSAGLDSYRYGVRAIRMDLLGTGGWRMARDGNVEATVNDALSIQLIFQNVDRACGDQEPEAISGKGAGSRAIVNRGQLGLFGAINEIAQHGAAPTVWLVCVSVDQSNLRAEVSCPYSFEGNQFEGFSKRIFVVDENFDGPLNWDRDDDLDSTADEQLPDVPVSKK